MKLNKLFLLAGIIAATLSSCSSKDNYTDGAPASGNQLQAVTFGENNIVSKELDPTDATTQAITVYRDASQSSSAASVPVSVITNTDGVFSVPATADFAAGASETQVTVSFPNAEIGKSYSLEVSLDDAYVNPYKSTSYKTYAFTVQRVKWNLLGQGTLIDDFWFGDYLDVDIYQRDDNPLVYRCTNPYTNDYVLSWDETPAGTYTPYITFTTTKSGYVTWTAHDWYNVFSTSYSANIQPYYYSNNADECYIEYNEEGGIQYFSIKPYFYLASISAGWTAYYLYLVFPGQKMPEGYGEEE